MIAEKHHRFCKLLAELIKESKMTNIDFYTKLGIKKPYFYDILSGKVNPPPRERQFDMIKLLKPSKEKTILFFDIAAQERGEVPADVSEQLKNDEVLASLRRNIDYTKFTEMGDIKNG